jgi:hypothetical protein
MWKQTTKLPAWINLTGTHLPNLTPATQRETEALQEVIGECLFIERIELNGRHLQMYRIKNDPSVGDYLVRWLPSNQYDETIDTYNFSLWLNTQDFLTPYPVIKPFQLKSLNDGLIYGVKYYQHRLLSPIPSDMIELATRLAQFHDILPRHKNHDVWKKNTEKRMRTLSRVRDSLANGEWRSGPDPDRLCEIAKDRSLDFIRDDLPRQSLHGDLNYRNAFVPTVELDQSSLQVMLLDFEDVKHSVLPVVFELALVIERFILVHDLDNETAVTAAQVFLSSYQNKCLHELNLNKVDWVSILQSLNLRSLCVLSLIENQGGDIPEDEWKKFFYLFECVKQQADLWHCIAS